MRTSLSKPFHVGIRAVTSTLAIIALALVVVPAAHADLIDFGIPSLSGGTVSYAGGTTPLVVSGAAVTSITDKTTSTTLTSAGTLALTSGNETSFSSGPPAELYFGGNSTPGSVTIDGTVVSAGITTSTNLLTGTVTGASVINGSLGTAVDVSTIINSINSTLLTFLTGSSAGNLFGGTLNLSFTLAANDAIGTAAFTGATNSGDLVDAPTPEPGSLVLIAIGIGLIGFAVRRRNVLDDLSAA